MPTLQGLSSLLPFFLLSVAWIVFTLARAGARRRRARARPRPAPAESPSASAQPANEYPAPLTIPEPPVSSVPLSFPEPLPRAGQGAESWRAPAAAPAPLPGRPPGPRAPAALARLERLPPWQRAVLLADILGPPRGLQEGAGREP